MRDISLGNWVVNGNALVAQGRRGGVEYPFNLSAADVYRLQIEGTQNLANSSHNKFDLVLSVDGLDLGRYNLVAGYGTNGTVGCWTPYLLAGPHTLRVFWDNAANLTSLRINSVRVQTGTGPDSNGDGIKDWVTAWVNTECGLDLTNNSLTSYVSPICLEGRDPYPPLMKIAVAGADGKSLPNVTPETAPNGRWYANIPLANSGDTTVQITYQNGAKSESRQLHWALVNVLQGGNFSIRKGDKLTFVAQPNGAVKGQVLFTVGTNQVPARPSTQQFVYRFPDAGEFTVMGTYASPLGISQSGSVTVNVVSHSFNTQPDCWVGKTCDWDIPSIATQVVLEADSRLFCEQTATLPDNGVVISLLTDQPEPRYVLSRLGNAGPILGSTKVNGFGVFAAPDTYNRIIDTYSDGSRLVESMLILSPVLSDLTVQLRVIVGGVIFDDGTTYREVSATDFDTLAQYKFRFVLPASVKTANCHSIKIIQGADTVVGTY